MLLKMYSVFDIKAEAYMPPFYQKARGEAVRAFSDTANDPTSMLYKHAEDYILFEIGEYEDTTAELTPFKSHVNLGKAIEYQEYNHHTDAPNASINIAS